MPIGDQDKPWTPHIICGSCQSTLEERLRGTRRVWPLLFTEYGENQQTNIIITTAA